MKHHKLRFNPMVWRYPEAPAELARALGQIAADLWVAGKLVLTEDHFVATLAVDAEAATPGEDRDDQVAGDGGGREAVA